MQVTAFNRPQDPAWRWRIVNVAGEMVAESTESFPSIAAAVAKGRAQLAAMNLVDRSVPGNRLRSGQRRRGVPGPPSA
jgi:hypothetical protein